MKPTIQVLGDAFIYSCTFDKAFAYEQFIPEHILSYQIAGKTQIFHQGGEIILEAGQLILAHRNQFAKSTKIPAKNKKYEAFSVILTSERLRKFALENNLLLQNNYRGKKNIVFKPNNLLKAYFQSIMPYVDEWKKVGPKLASMKVNESIELLLQQQPELKAFLFDFNDPNKSDLEEFMTKNFHYNVSLEHFAKLSGRSLTSFKRDFASIFKETPSNWLKNKRLSEAYYLLKKKNKKPQDIYLSLGFENLSHFYTAFKQKYGTTPAKI